MLLAIKRGCIILIRKYQKFSRNKSFGKYIEIIYLNVEFRKNDKIL
jgi:hypothetical protein